VKTQDSSQPKVWVTGAAGLIGNCLIQSAAAELPGHQVMRLVRNADGVLPETTLALDLTDFVAVRRAFQEHRPQLVIHCAAMSRSPLCQSQPQEARRANVDATQNLADLAADIPFIFFSTDLVFDGAAGNYLEDSPVNPLSIYAETKVAAEALVRTNPRHTIVRVALNAGVSLTGNRAFNEEMRLAWQAGRPLNLFTDEFRCVIPAPATARAVWELAKQPVPGTFHLGGSEKLSRYEIGQLLAARWPELKPQIIPSSLREYRGAPRAPDVSMNCAKLQGLLSFPLPRFSAWLTAHPHEKI
jgi:dTDP-4-dehydrorhamnose reductase